MISPLKRVKSQSRRPFIGRQNTYSFQRRSKEVQNVPGSGLPKAKTFSQRSRNSPSSNVFMISATFGGSRFKLKFDNAFSAGMRDWFSSRSIRFHCRSSHSRVTSCKR
jgi:hypothetical protein